jgi:hypothetical protein
LGAQKYFLLGAFLHLHLNIIMIYQTDPELLGLRLAQFAFLNTVLPEETKLRLQRMVTMGARLETFVEAAELIYAYRELLDSEALSLLGDLFHYGQYKGWPSCVQNRRADRVIQGIRRDSGESGPPKGWPSVWDDPEPEAHYRDNVNWKSTIELTLPLAKEKKWVEAKVKRHLVQFGGTATPMGPIDTDPESQNKVTGAVVMALVLQANFNVPWTMKDNSVVMMDATMMTQVGMLVGHHVATCHAVGQVIRGHIDACETIEQVQSLDLDVYPWPVNP